MSKNCSKSKENFTETPIQKERLRIAKQGANFDNFSLDLSLKFGLKVTSNIKY